MRINLLPHRDWALTRERQFFVVSLVIAALLGLVLAIGTSLWLGHQLRAQLTSNKILNNQISVVDRSLTIESQVNEDIVKLILTLKKKDLY